MIEAILQGFVLSTTRLNLHIYIYYNIRQPKYTQVISQILTAHSHLNDNRHTGRHKHRIGQHNLCTTLTRLEADLEESYYSHESQSSYSLYSTRQEKKSGQFYQIYHQHDLSSQI